MALTSSSNLWRHATPPLQPERRRRRHTFVAIAVPLNRATFPRKRRAVRPLRNRLHGTEHSARGLGAVALTGDSESPAGCDRQLRVGRRAALTSRAKPSVTATAPVRMEGTQRSRCHAERALL